MFGLAVLFLLVRLPEEVDRVDDEVDDDFIVRACAGTPLEQASREVAADPGIDPQEHAQVSGFERWNLILVLLVIQTVQVLLLSVTVFVFFMLFGSLVMETETQLAWTGADTVGQAPLLSNVSLSLVKVSLFLASFSGLYFTVSAVTDDTYRRQFFSVVESQLERAVGMRAVYLAIRERGRPTAPDGHRGRVPDARVGGAPSHRPDVRNVGCTHRPRRWSLTSGVEVLLDQRGDRVDRGLVVAGDLDRVAVAGAQGHDHQRGARVDAVDGHVRAELGGLLGDDRGGTGVEADGGADDDGLAGHGAP